MMPETLSRTLLQPKNNGTLMVIGREIMLRKGFFFDRSKE
jgi:hypothetical protein